MRRTGIVLALIVGIVVGMIFVGSAAAQSDRVLNQASNNTDNVTATVEIDEDNTTAEEVVIQEANYSEGKYFVVVEDDENETVGESSELDQGENTNVTVEFDNPLGDNTTITASIYTSDNGSVGSSVNGTNASTEFDIDVVGGGDTTGNDLPVVGSLPFIGDQSPMAAILIIVGLVVVLVGIVYFVWREMKEEDMG